MIIFNSLEAICSQWEIYCAQNLKRWRDLQQKGAEGECRCANSVYNLNLTVVRGRPLCCNNRRDTQRLTLTLEILKNEGQRSRHGQGTQAGK